MTCNCHICGPDWSDRYASARYEEENTLDMRLIHTGAAELFHVLRIKQDIAEDKAAKWVENWLDENSDLDLRQIGRHRAEIIEYERDVL